MKQYNVGDTFPNLLISTAYKEDQYVYDVLRGKTIFWVLRYIGCPVCRYDVAQIAANYNEFRAHNAQVFVVMQSDKTHIRETIGADELPFDIICDNDMRFYQTLMIHPAESMDALAGTRKDKLQKKGALADENGFTHGDYEGDELQLPAMFIVDENRKISYVHYAKELADMPEIDEVLNLLS